MIGRLKNFARESYKSFSKSSVYSALKRIVFLRRMKLRAGKMIWKVAPYNYPLHGDPVASRAFEILVKQGKIKAIVETGTFRGFTTSLLATKFPNIPIYTCEINEYNYKKAKENLKKFKNVQVYHSSSPDFLDLIIKQKKIKDKVLFYLDAHWLDEWPLEDELKIITSKIKGSIIVIDDFKVPGDERYQFDKYGGKECSMDMVLPNIKKKGKYNALFPKYGYEIFRKDVDHPDLVGYVILFHNMVTEYISFMKEEFVKRFFKDETQLIKSNK